MALPGVVVRILELGKGNALGRIGLEENLGIGGVEVLRFSSRREGTRAHSRHAAGAECRFQHQLFAGSGRFFDHPGRRGRTVAAAAHRREGRFVVVFDNDVFPLGAHLLRHHHGDGVGSVNPRAGALRRDVHLAGTQVHGRGIVGDGMPRAHLVAEGHAVHSAVGQLFGAGFVILPFRQLFARSYASVIAGHRGVIVLRLGSMEVPGGDVDHIHAQFFARSSVRRPSSYPSRTGNAGR